jgi:hypothetical protein
MKNQEDYLKEAFVSHFKEDSKIEWRDFIHAFI